jgi:hypothetical protein
MGLQTSDRREDERLIDAIVARVMAHVPTQDEPRSIFLDEVFLDILLELLESRRGQNCALCGRSIKGHLIEFLENGIDHNFSPG